MRNRSFVSSGALTLATSGVALLLGVLTSVVVARSLGPAGKGVLAVAISVINILSGIGQFGLLEVLLFQMGTERRRLAELAANNFVVVSGSTALAAVFLWLSYPVFEQTFYRGVDASLLWAAFLILPLNLIFLFFSRLVQLEGRIVGYNALLLLFRGAGLAGVVLCLREWPADPRAVVWGMVGGQGLGALAAILLVRLRIAPRDWRIDLALLGQSLRSGLKVQWGMAAHMVGQYTGIFVLNYHLSSRDVGWYSTAMGMALHVLLLSDAARTVLQAWMPKACDDGATVAERTVLVARHTALILCVVCLAMGVLGKTLIEVMYGVEFAPSYAPMTVLLAGMIARGLGQIVLSQLTFDGHLNLTSLAAGLGVALNLSLAWNLVPLAGVWGAVLAAVASECLQAAFLVYWFAKKSDRQAREFVPRINDVLLYVKLIEARCRRTA